MRSQPNRDYISDDVVQTPPALARRLVGHFRPWGRVLEPCKGRGNLLRALRAHARRGVAAAGAQDGDAGRKSAAAEIAWCEIQQGRDFYHWTNRVDWIVTNPPWSQVRRFLQHAMAVADHVVFLVTINHVWTRARVADIRNAGFGLREIVLLDMPPSFPQSGFQLGAVYFVRGWKGATTVTDWTRDAGRAGRGAVMVASARRPRGRGVGMAEGVVALQRRQLSEALRASAPVALVRRERRPKF